MKGLIMTELEAMKIYSELHSLREELERLNKQVERLRPTVRTDHPHIIRIDGVRGVQIDGHE
jgi:hypothetical protein